MKNGQLRPAYNVQISTLNQFIVNYTIHPNPTDTTTLKDHLTQHETSFKSFPKVVIADAGYGSQENYTLLEDNEIAAYLKYSMFDKQQSSNFNQKYPFSSDKLFYNQRSDCYICPMGQKIDYIGDAHRRTSTGFVQTSRKYQAKNCYGCPLNGACHKSKGDRIIQVNVELERQKKQAHDLLNSEDGIAHRKKRCFDVEPIFGNINRIAEAREPSVPKIYAPWKRKSCNRMEFDCNCTKYQKESGVKCQEKRVSSRKWSKKL